MYVFKALCSVDKGRSKIELTPLSFRVLGLLSAIDA